MKYSIGNDAGRQDHSNQQVGDHFGTTCPILGEQLPRSRVIIFRKLKPVTPILSTIKGQVCERFRICQVQNICPGRRREVKRRDRRTSAYVGRHSERRSSKHTKWKLTLEMNDVRWKKDLQRAKPNGNSQTAVEWQKIENKGKQPDTAKHQR